MTLRPLRFALMAVLAVLCSLAVNVSAQPVDINFVAHADDDGFFQNPDIFNAMLDQHTIVTVYISSSNVQVDDFYYMYQREMGSMHAHAGMAAAAAYMDANGIVPGQGQGWDPGLMDQSFEAISPDATRWNIGEKTYGGIIVTQADCIGYPNVHLIFLRFPASASIAGDPISTSVLGTTVTPPLQTLGSIYNNPGLTQAAMDGSTVYSKATLTNVLVGILKAYKPSVIRSLDFLNPGLKDGSIYDPGSIHYDHLDHYWSAWFVHDAVHTYAKSKPKITPTLWDYRGYNMYTYPDNSTLLPAFFAEIKYWPLYYYSYYDFHFNELIYTNDYSNEPSYTYTRGCVSQQNCLTGFPAFQDNENQGVQGFTNNEENHQGPTQVYPLP